MHARGQGYMCWLCACMHLNPPPLLPHVLAPHARPCMAPMRHWAHLCEQGALRYRLCGFLGRQRNVPKGRHAHVARRPPPRQLVHAAPRQRREGFYLRLPKVEQPVHHVQQVLPAAGAGLGAVKVAYGSHHRDWETANAAPAHAVCPNLELLRTQLCAPELIFAWFKKLHMCSVAEEVKIEHCKMLLLWAGRHKATLASMLCAIASAQGTQRSLMTSSERRLTGSSIKLDAGSNPMARRGATLQPPSHRSSTIPDAIDHHHR